ncbi:AraC family transcriptional regulator [Paenibacillus mucilaginosus]|uniref:Transcriptional regulator, AraC family n=1 Tax=Paenibacillus mucilaginosus (strain KNP414) TaxID=1036673 RepID=F8F559_PAEMK|nr:AraC family transcriptional regulator [Paenibacillus mucilaginosus]AEI40789.1 transcriptional regulator, AraC family [Paenibacillus mucilaginosus KNP414]MCG7211737.1 AraC family transcriptional regulator [Paenibacillus mucilaginosus]WDM29909.1 helix-turn-helix transcriptional regulator [Paenibacillus mucilaginosus]
MSCLKISIDTPVRFLAAGEFISETPWTHAARSMGCYELIIGVSETVYLREEDMRFEVGPGDALLLRPGLAHGGYRASPPGVKFYWFHFDCPQGAQWLTAPAMKRTAEEIQARAHRAWSVGEVYLPQHLHIEQKERIGILVSQILHVANANYLTAHSVNYLLTSLFIEISEQVLAPTPARGARMQGDAQFIKMAEWTRIHAEEPLTVSALAAKFNYNKDYLTRLFKQHTGMGPLDFIHSVRIAKAKELLSRTALSVREIAAEAGYPDDKYFMRLFRQHTNMTPTQYRNAYHKTFMNNV